MASKQTRIDISNKSGKQAWEAAEEDLKQGKADDAKVYFGKTRLFTMRLDSDGEVSYETTNAGAAFLAMVSDASRPVLVVDDDFLNAYTKNYFEAMYEVIFKGADKVEVQVGDLVLATVKATDDAEDGSPMKMTEHYQFVSPSHLFNR